MFGSEPVSFAWGVLGESGGCGGGGCGGSGCGGGGCGVGGCGGGGCGTCGGGGCGVYGLSSCSVGGNNTGNRSQATRRRPPITYFSDGKYSKRPINADGDGTLCSSYHVFGTKSPLKTIQSKRDIFDSANTKVMLALNFELNCLSGAFNSISSVLVPCSNTYL
jgi:hypothetical protein